MNGLELVEQAVVKIIGDELKKIQPALTEALNALEARIVELEKRLAGGSQ